LLTHPTLDLLHDLGLHGMAKSFRDMADNPESVALGHAEWLGDHWYEIVGNPTLADAILDRIIHNAHRIELHGETLRKPQAGGSAVP
jgi:hypothetical protein